MALLGAALLYRSRLRRLGRLTGRLVAPSSGGSRDVVPLAAQRIAFGCLVAFCLTIPSNWTQDIPSRYGGRHPGLEYSWLYPMIDTAPPPEETAAPGESRRRFDVGTLGVAQGAELRPALNWYTASQAPRSDKGQPVEVPRGRRGPGRRARCPRRRARRGAPATQCRRAGHQPRIWRSRSVHGVVQNLFRVGRHLLRATSRSSPRAPHPSVRRMERGDVCFVSSRPSSDLGRRPGPRPAS